MDIIIEFNKNNICNRIDKMIFHQYYPDNKINENDNLMNGLNCCFSCVCVPKSRTERDMFLDSDLIKLFDGEYMMFLKSKYFKNKALLKYFDKYNIVYLDYSYREKIIYILKMINFFIINSTVDQKITFIERTKIHNLNHLYFLNNEFEPNTLYKKISFSNQDLFLPFNTYAIKKIEYRLRTFCQIAEKLGAEKINIKYDSKFLSDNQLSVNINALADNAKIASETKITRSLDNTIDLEFRYPNNYSNLNLNKFEIINLIRNEKQFFIQSDEYDADIDLKFLIDARCINLIQKYNTHFVINCLNEIEQNIMIKVKNYGLNGSFVSKKSNNVQINININFINIYENPSCINGSNIYMEKEGFDYLVGIINAEEKQLKSDINDFENNEKKTDDIPKDNLINNKKEDRLKLNNLDILIKHGNIDKLTNKNISYENISIYKKINNYLRSNLEYETKKKYMNKKISKMKNKCIYSYFEYQDLIKSYKYIIENNFDEKEQNKLFYNYFNNNLNYYNFEIFKNIIISGTKKRLDKLSFISVQYHIIQKYKYHMLCILFRELEYIYSSKSHNSLNDELYEYIENIIKKLLNSSCGPIFNLEISNIRNELNRIILGDINKKNYIFKEQNKENIEESKNKVLEIINIIIENIDKANLEVLQLIEYEFEIKNYSKSSNRIQTLCEYLHIYYYNGYISEFLDKIYNSYDKIKELNIKFRNNIPKNNIPKLRLVSNYNKYRLLFLWNDLINTLNEYALIDQLPFSTHPDLIPISYSRLSELMYIDKISREKFKLVSDEDLNEDIQLYYGPLWLPGLTKSNYEVFNNIDSNSEVTIMDHNIEYTDSPQKNIINNDKYVCDNCKEFISIDNISSYKFGIWECPKCKFSNMIRSNTIDINSLQLSTNRETENDKQLLIEKQDNDINQELSKESDSKPEIPYGKILCSPNYSPTSMSSQIILCNPDQENKPVSPRKSINYENTPKSPMKYSSSSKNKVVLEMKNNQLVCVLNEYNNSAEKI